MPIELDILKTVKVQAKELRIYCKVCDNFTASLHDQEGVTICTQVDGYVPGFMPGKHYGDYIILNIDIETGMVTNWVRPSAMEIAEWVSTLKGDD
jgi:hypothetical protein